MRTQKDRDEDLALGRELERKDAEIARLRERCEAYKGQVEAGANKIERLRAALRGIAEYCSGEDRTLGAIERLIHIRNTADQAARSCEQ